MWHNFDLCVVPQKPTSLFCGNITVSAFLVLLLEAPPFLSIPTSIAANMRQIIYGGILVFMMWKIPKS
jgi:hypothetical protein